MNAIAGLARAARALRELGARADGDPIARIDWCRPQWDFLDCRDNRKMLRTGNRVGKTTVGLAECILIALGKHPHQRFEPPCEIWILFLSRSQSLPLQSKLADLLAPAWLHPDQKPYNPQTGYGHHEPVIRFRNGSIIRIRTVNQGGRGLAGGHVHHILLDEPPKPRVYAECLARVRGTGGTISLTLTPVNEDCTFLRELVEEERLTDLHYPLAEENVRHLKSGQLRRTDAGEVMDAAWIAEKREESLPHEVPVVIDGEWEMRAAGQVFKGFREIGPGKHVVDAAPNRELILSLGIDHGQLVGKQTAVLVGVDESAMATAGFPSVWTLDEDRSSGMSTRDQDAVAILSMLERNGLQWSDLDYAFGDRMLGNARDTDRKSNKDLEEEIRKLLGLKSVDQLRPRIRTAKRGAGRGAGSPWRGYGWMHRQMLRPGGYNVVSTCTGVIAGKLRFDGDPRHPDKDLTDAERYAYDPWIFDNRKRVFSRPLIVA